MAPAATSRSISARLVPSSSSTSTVCSPSRGAARRSGDRPMLAGRSPEDIEALYRKREPFYRQAHLTVDTTALGVDQVVAKVMAAQRGAHADAVR